MSLYVVPIISKRNIRNITSHGVLYFNSGRLIKKEKCKVLFWWKWIQIQEIKGEWNNIERIKSWSEKVLSAVCGDFFFKIAVKFEKCQP